MTNTDVIRLAKDWTRAHQAGAFIYREDGKWGWITEEEYRYWGIPENAVTMYIWGGEVEEVY